MMPLHADELDIAMHRQPEGRCELPMEMELGECGHAAQLVQVQIAVEILINVIQDPLHPGMVVSKRRRHHLVLAVAEPDSPAQALYARPILRDYQTSLFSNSVDL